MPPIAVDKPPSRAATVERFFEAIQAGDYATLEAVLLPEATSRLDFEMPCRRPRRSHEASDPRTSSVRGEDDDFEERARARLIADGRELIARAAPGSRPTFP